jgi:GTP1/Obg family GTP-binding protein
MKTKLTLIPLAAVATIALFSGKANAQCSNDLVTLAHQIEGTARKLHTEFRVHYSHNSAYRHLMSDISQVINEARHIDSLAHNVHSSLHHIQADLRDLDKLAHHLHALVDAVDRGRYCGHVDGDTRHVHSLLSSLNGSIHQMQRVVAAYTAPPVHHHSGHHGYHSSSHAVGSIIESIIRARLGHHGHH